MSFTTENKIRRLINNHTRQIFEVTGIAPDHFTVLEIGNRGKSNEPFCFYFDELLDSFRSGAISVDGISDIDSLFSELRYVAVRAELVSEKEMRARDNAAIDEIISLNGSEEN